MGGSSSRPVPIIVLYGNPFACYQLNKCCLVKNHGLRLGILTESTSQQLEDNYPFFEKRSQLPGMTERHAYHFANGCVVAPLESSSLSAMAGKADLDYLFLQVPQDFTRNPTAFVTALRKKPAVYNVYRVVMVMLPEDVSKVMEDFKESTVIPTVITTPTASANTSSPKSETPVSTPTTTSGGKSFEKMCEVLKGLGIATDVVLCAAQNKKFPEWLAETVLPRINATILVHDFCIKRYERSELPDFITPFMSKLHIPTPQMIRLAAHRILSSVPAAAASAPSTPVTSSTRAADGEAQQPEDVEDLPAYVADPNFVSHVHSVWIDLPNPIDERELDVWLDKWVGEQGGSTAPPMFELQTLSGVCTVWQRPEQILRLHSTITTLEAEWESKTGGFDGITLCAVGCRIKDSGMFEELRKVVMPAGGPKTQFQKTVGAEMPLKPNFRYGCKNRSVCF